ncbi:MAG: hypothetical protein IBJ10_06090 [Phycisphaerales bacterium]|nr:hypothetical protein [Phycisphaerales bacterium]
MTRSITLGAAAGLALHAAALAGAPDLVVADMNGVTKWTPTPAPAGVQAYSFGINTCNIGDGAAVWNSNNALHPVFAQNVHRIANGRIEQIGLGFAWHGIVPPLQQSVCGVCSPGGPAELGIGCSSPDSASTLGQQTALAPRSTVNASTGALVFPLPPNNCSGASTATCERVQVDEADLADPSAIYLAESVVVHFGDAGAGATANNATWRRMGVAANFAMAPVGAAQNGSAVRAWQALNNNGAFDPSILVDDVISPGDGVYVVGSTAFPVGNGRWRYVVAVENISSDRSLYGLVVPMGAGDASPQGFTFHAPQYHSGEVYSNADWMLLIGDATFRWRSPQSFAQNPNANALRWGTLYTFTYTAYAQPTNGFVGLELFKPGSPGLLTADAVVSGAVSTYCPGDANNDGVVNFADLNVLLGTYGLTGVDLPADANGDGNITFDDLNLLLGGFGQAC